MDASLIAAAISVIAGWFHVAPASLAAVALVLFVASELLSLIPAVKANGVCQVIFGVTKSLWTKMSDKFTGVK
jgi:hypothetical protein